MFFVNSQPIIHIVIHTGEKPDLCIICDTTFLTTSDSNYSIQSHTQEKPYKCNICGPSISDPELFHRAQTGEKPYQCKFCVIIFYSKLDFIPKMGLLFKSSSVFMFVYSNLSTICISKTIIGEKPYQCKSCDSYFNARTNLKIQQRTHTGEKLMSKYNNKTKCNHMGFMKLRNFLNYGRYYY